MDDRRWAERPEMLIDFFCFHSFPLVFLFYEKDDWVYLFWGNFVRAELIVHNVSLDRRKSVPFDVMNLNPKETKL
jgi:hypothetical protein